MAVDWRLRLQRALSRSSADEEAAQPAQPATDTPIEAAQGLEGLVERGGAGVPAQLIAVEAICPNPYQPRIAIDGAALQGLAESIRQHGLLQPILVRQTGPVQYELVAGHRRLLALRMLGHTHVPAIILHAGADEAGMLALIENIQREDLHFLEEAAAYERLLRDFPLTQEELAVKLGKAQSTVANKLRLLRLPESVRQIVSNPLFSERHARALLGLENEADQRAVAAAVEAEGLTVRQTEDLVSRLASQPVTDDNARGQSGRQSLKGVFRDVRILSNTFRSAVEHLRAAGLAADIEETEHDQGLEIRVFVQLPAGWRRRKRPS